MKKFLALSAAVLLVAGSTGCGCCGLFRGRTQAVAMPAAVNYAPTCNSCDPCGCDGGGYMGGEVYGQPTMYGG